MNARKRAHAEASLLTGAVEKLCAFVHNKAAQKVASAATLTMLKSVLEDLTMLDDRTAVWPWIVYDTVSLQKKQ